MNSGVNVIMPTFNRPDSAFNVITSFKQQTFQIYQILVVDDGSKEENYIKLKKSLEQLNDPKVTLLRNPTNGGIPVALNRAFDLCTLEYTTWISDDNDYHANFLEVLVNAMKPSNCYAYASHNVVNKVEKNSRLVSRRYKNTVDLIKHFMGIASFMWETKFMKDVVGKYNEHINGVEDFDYHIRTFFKTTCIGFSSKSLVTFYRTYDSLFYKKRSQISKRRADLVKLYTMYLTIRNKLPAKIYMYVTPNKLDVNKMLNSDFKIVATGDRICKYDSTTNCWQINFLYYQSVMSLLNDNNKQVVCSYM